jgi:hypothetical protein
LSKRISLVQLGCKQGLISFSGKSTEKTSENKILFEVHGRLTGDGNDKKHEMKIQRPAEQTSLFCSRFFRAFDLA